MTSAHDAVVWTVCLANWARVAPDVKRDFHRLFITTEYDADRHAIPASKNMWDSPERTAAGWFIRENRLFSLDLDLMEVVVEGEALRGRRISAWYGAEPFAEVIGSLCAATDAVCSISDTLAVLR